MRYSSARFSGNGWRRKAAGVLRFASLSLALVFAVGLLGPSAFLSVPTAVTALAAGAPDETGGGATDGGFGGGATDGGSGGDATDGGAGGDGTDGGASAANVADGASFAAAFNKISDPDTSNAIDWFADSALDNGRLWTDKTVSANRALICDAAGKPTFGIDAKTDEFLVTLSALSQSYNSDAIVEPTDTVFILDISASMYINKLDNGKSRVEVMVDALNGAIGMLMDGNPGNRIAVIAFGGDSGNSRICPILRLAHHEVSSSAYFSMKSAAYIQVSSQIPDSALFDPAYRNIRVNGGTPTQRGIYDGAKILMDTTDTTYAQNVNGQTVTVTRKPNIVLLSDGGATLGWTDYKFANPLSDTDDGFDCGDANTSDIGISALTVMTAAYCKEQVKEHYYGTGETAKTAGFYTIGLSIAGTGYDAPAVLNPAANADKVSRVYLKNTYNMKSILDNYTSLPGGSDISFPALNKGSASARRLVSVKNTDNYVKNYDYVDSYYSAEKADDLTNAFQSIMQRIVSTGNYSTKLDSEDANFDGYLIFSDVLSEYIEFKGSEGMWFDNSMYDGHLFARSMTSGDSTQRDLFVIAMMEHQDYFGKEQSEARVIAGSLLDSCIAANKEDGGLYYISESDFSNRIRYYADGKRIYVGRYFNLDGSVADVPDGAKCVVDLFTMEGTAKNQMNGEATNLMDVAVHVVTALVDGEFECVFSNGEALVRSLKAGQQVVRWYIPASLIPMRAVTVKYNDAGTDIVGVQVKEALPIRYIYSVGLKDGFGLADLSDAYKADAANRVMDVDDDGDDEVVAYNFYTNAWNDPKNISMAFFEPSDTNPYYNNSDGGGAAGAAAGFRRKSDNATGTNPYVTEVADVAVNDAIVHVQHLGNNGRLTVPLTEIDAIKFWYPSGEATDDMYVQLYLNGLPLGDPVQLKEFEYDEYGEFFEYAWKGLLLYQMSPDQDGNAVMNIYTVQEGSLTNSEFAPYAGNRVPNSDFLIFYQQPTWEPPSEYLGILQRGFWNEAWIVNWNPNPVLSVDELWYLTIEKNVQGDVPAWDDDSGVRIKYEIYRVVDGESDEQIEYGYCPCVYPFFFPDGSRYIPINGHGNYLIREVDGGAVAGYSSTVSITTDYDIDKTEIGGSGGDEILLKDVGAGDEVTVTFANTYEDTNFAELTLKKTFTGDTIGQCPDDIVFEIVGANPDSDSEIYRNMVYYAELDPDLGYTLVNLRPGVYKIRESGGEVAGFSRTLTTTVSGGDFTGSVTLAAQDSVVVEMNNDYAKHGNLTIRKTVSGLDLSTHAPDIVFQVIGRDGKGKVIYERYVEFCEFDGDGSYVLADIMPGAYTVTETGGEVDGYDMVSVPANNSITIEIEHDGNENKTAMFSNTYSPNGTGNGNGNGNGNGGGNGGNGGDNVTYFPNNNVSEDPHIDSNIFVRDHVWYIRGYEDNTIRPEASITRAEIAVIFYRLLVPELREIEAEARFSDVRGDEWYGAAVDLLAYHGILSGYPDGSFKPNRAITRCELAAVVSVFEHLVETSENPYQDLDPSGWAYKYILSATKKGWFVGDGTGVFRPDAPLKRAEFVTVANRVLKRNILLEDIPDSLHQWADLDASHWSYAAFTESIYSHDYEYTHEYTHAHTRKMLGETWTCIYGDGISAPYNR